MKIIQLQTVPNRTKKKENNELSIVNSRNERRLQSKNLAYISFSCNKKKKKNEDKFHHVE